MSTELLCMALENQFWDALRDPYSSISTPSWVEPEARLYEVLRNELCAVGSDGLLVDLLQIVAKAQETDGRARDFLAAFCKAYVGQHIGELMAEEAAEEASHEWEGAPCLVV